MLELLHIENIAIIEAADIEFAPGFNALTGETGAGKSIVIDSLSAVLGQRTSRELIRTGAEKAFVSAAFSGTVPELTETLGIQPEADGTLLLQREIQTDGKNVCRVNGRPVTVGQLRALGAQLLNIHGQHDGQQLLDEEQHIVYLDSFGRAGSLINTYAEKYKHFTDIRRQIGALQMDEAEKARRVDTLQYQIEELRRAKLKPGEEEELTARRGMLRNAEKFLDAVAGADYALNGDDSGGGALSALRQAQDALGGVRHLDDAFGQLYERLGEAYSEVYDIAATVEDKRGELDVSPGELDRVESRMDLLYRLKKKYGATVEDMLDYQARCEAELAQIEDAGDTLARLEQALSKAEKEARQAAQALSDARKAAAEQLTSQILAELQQLDMGKIRFAVDFAEKPLDSDGMDTVRFLMSANVGEELRPIHKIASGGELARIMLAMKNVLSEQDHVGTMVFDEVDTGVSGRAAQKVAEKMARISRRKQVLCVTHLPQLAAMADTHFSVEKGERGGRTYTEVRRLDRDQRRRELARLTGGSHVSQTMLDGAEELLVQAEKFRAEL
ncbi:DNA repair protein RecN [Vescimonas sanitatis]|uniref:DNA repair protein RecN n=1 Tax=Vescimonas sanitatis TaxID=3376993 RepID=UPI003B781223